MELEPASVRVFKLSTLNIFEIAIEFYLKHHWDVGKAALGFEPGRIRTIVSIATDSSHRVTIGKSC